MLVDFFRAVHKVLPDDIYYNIKEKVVFWNHKFRKSIIVIGDSHTGFFIFNGNRTWSNPKDQSQKLHFSIKPQGPALAYNLNKYGTATKAREQIEELCKSSFVSKNGKEVFLCCFGEIDCRVHVIKQAEKKFNGNYEMVIDEIILHYCEFLIWLKQYGDVWCWGPVASQSEKTPIDPGFPRYGKECDRNKVTAYFNNKLRSACEENGIGFITVYPKLIDDNGMTKEQYYLDGVHLNQSAVSLANDQLEYLFNSLRNR